MSDKPPKIRSNKDPTPQYSIVLDDYDKEVLLDPDMRPKARIRYWRFIMTDTRNEKFAE